MAAAVGPVPEPIGRIAVLSGAGGDGPVAAEVAFVARVTGTEVSRAGDVGGSRVQPLLADPALLADVDCVVVVAGLDAGLAGAVAAMTDVPVVAVPTSAGHPSALGGLGALMTMLTSTTAGAVVSPVDNGWSAGVFAARIARRAGR
jgi:NCAIR mutase (PurE)-related protein